jgi:sterol desaturase/sphingolipid hydroxylase (fatty acid hydroxylase superfamily)
MQTRPSPLINEMDSSSSVSYAADNSAPILVTRDMHSFHHSQELRDSSYVEQFDVVDQAFGNNSSGIDFHKTHQTQNGKNSC